MAANILIKQCSIKELINLQREGLKLKWPDFTFSGETHLRTDIAVKVSLTSCM